RGSGDLASDRWIAVRPYGPEVAGPPTIDRQGASGSDRDWAIGLLDLEAWAFEDLAIRNSRTGIVYVGTNPLKLKRGLRILRCDFANIRGLPSHTERPEDDKRVYWWLRGSPAISITGLGYCRDGMPPTQDNCSGDSRPNLPTRFGSYSAGLSHVQIE